MLVRVLRWLQTVSMPGVDTASLTHQQLLRSMDALMDHQDAVAGQQRFAQWFGLRGVIHAANATGGNRLVRCVHAGRIKHGQWLP